jgi:hypothetical protein
MFFILSSTFLLLRVSCGHVLGSYVYSTELYLYEFLASEDAI